MADEIATLLTAWLPEQRWFGGKGRAIRRITLTQTTTLVAGDPRLDHSLAAVDHDGEVDYYQLPLGIRHEIPERLEHAAIGRVGNLIVYDAPHDPDLTRPILEGLAAGGRREALVFVPLASDIATELPSLIVGTEQSNSSVIYGEAYILKFFRRVSPGTNPDLEVTRALAERGCPRIIPPLAYLETTMDGRATTLALLQPFLRSATEGWALAATSIRDLYAEGDLHPDEVGGDFASESERLGAATAEVHRAMAEALPTGEAGPTQLQALVRQLHERLDRAITVVPELADVEKPIRATYDQLADRQASMPIQRIHGDLHLGQVMRTDSGWVLFDFEGEPARPLAERTALMSPLRDVAGMLRSFDYAAQHLLVDRPTSGQLAYRASEWAERNRAAYCDGYAAAGEVDPRTDETLLKAFELDKAVYEVVYETRNRPSWVAIPLRSIERLVS